MAKSKERDITPAEEIFVAEYMIDYNATRAFHRACPDVSYREAHKQAHRWRNRPHIMAEIDARKEARKARCELTAEEVIQEAQYLAFCDPIHLFSDDGFTPLNMRCIPPEVRRQIQTVKLGRETNVVVTTRKDGDTETTTRTSYQIIEYKLHPKRDGLDKLWTLLGLEKSLDPLERLLALLPPEFALAVRAALEPSIPQGSDSSRVKELTDGQVR